MSEAIAASAQHLRPFMARAADDLAAEPRAHAETGVQCTWFTTADAWRPPPI